MGNHVCDTCVTHICYIFDFQHVSHVGLHMFHMPVMHISHMWYMCPMYVSCMWYIPATHVSQVCHSHVFHMCGPYHQNTLFLISLYSNFKKCVKTCVNLQACVTYVAFFVSFICVAFSRLIGLTTCLSMNGVSTVLLKLLSISLKLNKNIVHHLKIYVVKNIWLTSAYGDNRTL